MGGRLLLTLTASLLLVFAVASPIVAVGLRYDAEQEGLRLVEADARAVAKAVRDREPGESALGEAAELIGVIAERRRVIDVRLIGSNGRTVVALEDSELGELETEPSVTAALKFGRRFVGSEAGDGDRAGDLQYVVPVDLPSGRHALELDQDGAFVNKSVASARLFLGQVMLASGVACVVLFYLLGGRRLIRLHRLALDRSRRDGLTDLGSQVAFHEELDQAVAVAVRHSEPLSVVVFDLDDFKLANDRHGHPHGDQLLKRVAEVLHSGRAGDRPFRLGGDEFAMILPKTDTDRALPVAQRLLQDVADRAGIAASIGVGELCLREAKPEVLYRQADAASFSAKRQGGGAVLAFRDLEGTEFIVGPDQAQSLHDLLDDGEITMAFQVVCDIDSLRPIGYEALARPASRYGFRGPAEAFTTAEQLHRAADLDDLCRRRAFEQAAWLPEATLLFVNLAPSSLKHRHVADRLAAQVREAGLSPARVVLEITEREQLRGDIVARAVEQLRAAGFKVALDDVGAGNAGLEMLRSAVFDFVKIDRSVVAAATTDRAARGVLLAVDSFARATGAFVIAEGIEEEETLAFLQRLDAEAAPNEPVRRGGQGFLLGRPETGPVGAQPAPPSVELVTG